MPTTGTILTYFEGQFRLHPELARETRTLARFTASALMKVTVVVQLSVYIETRTKLSS
jgi:hypothetical protein